MKFSGPLLAVKDIAASRKFYQDLFGLEVREDFGENITFTCGLSLQQGFDWLVGIDKDSIQTRPHNMALYFDGDDFDAFLSKLAASGAGLIHEVKEFPWGQRVVHVYDPDGHIIEAAESMSSAMRRHMDMGMTPEQISEKIGYPAELITTWLAQ